MWFSRPPPFPLPLHTSPLAPLFLSVHDPSPSASRLWTSHRYRQAKKNNTPPPPPCPLAFVALSLSLSLLALRQLRVPAQRHQCSVRSSLSHPLSPPPNTLTSLPRTPPPRQTHNNNSKENTNKHTTTTPPKKPHPSPFNTPLVFSVVSRCLPRDSRTRNPHLHTPFLPLSHTLSHTLPLSLSLSVPSSHFHLLCHLLFSTPLQKK